MVGSRACKATNSKGEPCRATLLHESDYCVFHDPAHADVVQEARKLGGNRRRKEVTLAVAFDFEGLDSVPDIRRLVEIAAMDALGLENTLGRVRALAYLAQVAAGLLEKGEMAERLEAIEAALGPRLQKPGDSKRRNWR